MRADQLLVARGLASTRAQARRLIAGGVRWRAQGDWKPVRKCGDELPDDATLHLLDESELRYVSRGGLKLEAALAHTGLNVAGLCCLDVGQSTGGFTDCLLQHGARHVVGVDVGSGQLHPSLRADPRVTCLEQVNARNLDAMLFEAINQDCIRAGALNDAEHFGDFGAAFSGFDLVVMDLSFISQTLVLPALLPLLGAGAAVLSLVKPQFELQPGQVGKRGMVKDAALYGVVEQRLRAACVSLGLRVSHWLDSPIAGGDGNREFFFVRAAREPPR